MELRLKDFHQALKDKSEKSLLRGIQFLLAHGDEGVQREFERLNEKPAAKPATKPPEGEKA